MTLFHEQLVKLAPGIKLGAALVKLYVKLFSLLSLIMTHCTSVGQEKYESELRREFI